MEEVKENEGESNVPRPKISVFDQLQSPAATDHTSVFDILGGHELNEGAKLKTQIPCKILDPLRGKHMSFNILVHRPQLISSNKDGQCQVTSEEGKMKSKARTRLKVLSCLP